LQTTQMPVWTEKSVSCPEQTFWHLSPKIWSCFQWVRPMSLPSPP
jgi:hypothetical protein